MFSIFVCFFYSCSQEVLIIEIISSDSVGMLQGSRRSSAKLPILLATGMINNKTRIQQYRINKWINGYIKSNKKQATTTNE